MHVGICNRLTLISCSWLDTILSMTLDVRKAGGRPGWIPSNYASFAWWPVADLVSGVRIGLLLPLLTLGHLNLDQDLTTLTTADQPSNWNLTRERGCILSGILCRYPHISPDSWSAGWMLTKLHRTLPARSAALCRIHQLHQSITSCSHLSVRLTSPSFSILKWTKVIINFWFISQISTQRLKTIFSLHHSASHKLTEADKTLKRNCGDLNWI